MKSVSEASPPPRGEIGNDERTCPIDGWLDGWRKNYAKELATRRLKLASIQTVIKRLPRTDNDGDWGCLFGSLRSIYVQRSKLSKESCKKVSLWRTIATQFSPVRSCYHCRISPKMVLLYELNKVYPCFCRKPLC